MRPATAAAFLALCAALCACGAHRSATAELGAANRTVFDALQHGQYQVLAGHLRPELRPDFLSRAYGAEKSLEIVEYTPISLDVFDERARSVTRISWYELPSTIVRTDTVFIDWARLERQWLIDTIAGGPMQVPDPAAP